ncbi:MULTISPECIES: tRNA 2-thiocytidine biosynthesis TtcA family protein [unclassified Halanaerobium]|uniref:tRNA 2-thiocytidine biosynthesis TtcA family protein n=1 Tax=unclassified Halanaerobium TaxID=2641197 RepID=UPI000DF25068|nr:MULTISPECIES: tRNA 2-thiocytidine biosynthesis TtcA family protein [unclassified Halanaerobium]RCW51433.1 tRNA(Ile)-lysidine synthase TilS/MesJ [Halanaerobium sp. MA284_MarDTE_T2]RCW89221.1 tRNA(Ile)-lysidine synthase TilS/MesJ [Halanaerobium sp. DL-01]
MELRLERWINHRIVKAMAEFEMIEEGDNVLVGLSGGKDSSFLLYALAVLKKYFSVQFNLKAATVNPGFNDKEIYDDLSFFADELNIQYEIIETEIAQYILNEDVDNPCSKCAHFRKGALVSYMKENNCNKLAFGHHYDDAVETFLMSIIYSGQISSLQPFRYLSQNNVYIIRPLIFLREDTIIREIKKLDINILESNCPYDKMNKRAEIKESFADLFRNKQLFYNTAAAMRAGRRIELWPEKKDEKMISEKMNYFWKGK